MQPTPTPSMRRTLTSRTARIIYVILAVYIAVVVVTNVAVARFSSGQRERNYQSLAPRGWHTIVPLSLSASYWSAVSQDIPGLILTCGFNYLRAHKRWWDNMAAAQDTGGGRLDSHPWRTRLLCHGGIYHRKEAFESLVALA